MEIETAVKAVQAGGLDIANIRRDDFSLPTLRPVRDRLRVEVLDGRPASMAGPTVRNPFPPAVSLRTIGC